MIYSSSRTELKTNSGTNKINKFPSCFIFILADLREHLSVSEMIRRKQARIVTVQKQCKDQWFLQDLKENLQTLILTQQHIIICDFCEWNAEPWDASCFHYRTVESSMCLIQGALCHYCTAVVSWSRVTFYVFPACHWGFWTITEAL